MICGKCQDKTFPREIKKAKCELCKREFGHNIDGFNICVLCSEQYNICMMCGTEYAMAVPSDEQELIDKLRWEGIGE